MTYLHKRVKSNISKVYLLTKTLLAKSQLLTTAVKTEYQKQMLNLKAIQPFRVKILRNKSFIKNNSKNTTLTVILELLINLN